MSLSKPTLDDLRIARDDQPESKSRFWPVIIALIVLTGAGVIILRVMRPTVVEVRTVLVRGTTGASVERTVLNASGYVTARRAATVSSKVTGKVIEVLIEEGMKVTQAQVLARLDDSNVKISLGLAEAQLSSATNALAETRVRIKEAEQELQRQTNLMKNRIATQADFDHAEAAALALKAKLLSSSWRIQLSARLSPAS
jgi:HlyD family secretion protein